MVQERIGNGGNLSVTKKIRQLGQPGFTPEIVPQEVEREKKFI